MATQIGGTIVWNLDVDDKSFSQKLGQAENRAKQFASSAEKSFSGMAQSLSTRLGNISQSLDNVGNQFIKFGAIPTAVLGLSAKAAISYEDSLADVRKTTGLTAEETEKLGQTILGLSKNTRTSASDLVDIAKIAGQLGVAKNQIVPFTEAINQAAVALGDEFTGGAEEVTKELGVLVNQFKLAGKEGENIAEGVTKVGSAINSLGAAGQATGPYMTDFSRRVGGIAPIVGLSIDKVLGLAAGLQELGQAPEVAGTAIQSLLVTMGKNVQEFAKIAGVSGQAFSKLLKEDINEALLLVAAGVSAGGGSVEELAQKLDGLGIDGQRTVAVLANLGNNTDLIREKQALANAELEKGTSLTDEYNIKNNTSAANIAKFMNNVNSLAVTLGNALLPAINNNLQAIIPVVDRFAEFASNNPELVTGILSAGAAFTTLGIAMKGVSIVLSGIKPLLDAAIWIKNTGAIATGIRGIGAAFAFFNVAIGPVGWVILAVVAAIALLAVAWHNNWGDIQGKTKTAIDFIMKTIQPLIDIGKAVGKYFQAVFETGDWANDWAHIEHMPQMLADVITKIGQFIVFVQEIPQKLSAFGTQISTFFTTLGTQISNFFIALPGNIASFFAALPGMIWEHFVRMGENIAFALGFILGLVIYGAPRIAEAIVSFFVELPGRLMAIFTQIYTDITTTFTNIWGWLTATVPMIISSVGAFFAALPGQIWGFVTATYNNIVIAFTNTWNWLRAIVPQIIATVVNFFATLPERVGVWLETMRVRVQQGFVDTWNSIVAEISTWPSRLYEWGANIANAFVNGIKSAIGRIVDAFKDGLNKAKSVVEGKSPPIAGPFKNIDLWGHNVGMAWVNGVRDAIETLTFDSPTLATAQVPTGAPVLQGAQGGRNVEKLVNIEHMEIRDESDITEVSRELAFRIETSTGFINNG